MNDPPGGRPIRRRHSSGLKFAAEPQAEIRMMETIEHHSAALTDCNEPREVRSLGTISSSDDSSSSTGRARGPERMRGASPSRRGSGEPGGLAIDSHNFYSFRNLTR